MKAITLLVALLASALAFAPPSSRLLSRNVRGSIKLYEAKQDIAAEKLVWDPQSGRFYERNLDEVCEEEFCLVDTETKQPILLTREEKERIFLDAIQSYYFSGKSTLSDEQFDRLREDLSWEGSALVSMNRNETLFMNAMQAYNKGKPVLSDAQFDDLKKSLKESGSKLAVAIEPKCYVDTGVCKVTWQKDQIRTAALYIPATLILSTIYIGVLYEIPFIRNNLNPLIALILGGFPIFAASKAITENVFFNEPSVARGACPKCGSENKIFFGDVLGVKGDSEESSGKCTNCKTSFTIKKSTLRVSTLIAKKTPPGKAPKEDEDA